MMKTKNMHNLYPIRKHSNIELGALASSQQVALQDSVIVIVDNVIIHHQSRWGGGDITAQMSS